MAEEKDPLMERAKAAQLEAYQRASRFVGLQDLYHNAVAKLAELEKLQADETTLVSFYIRPNPVNQPNGGTVDVTGLTLDAETKTLLCDLLRRQRDAARAELEQLLGQPPHVEFCGWCPEPHHPLVENHPDGTAEHREPKSANPFDKPWHLEERG